MELRNECIAKGAEVISRKQSKLVFYGVGKRRWLSCLQERPIRWIGYLELRVKQRLVMPNLLKKSILF